MSHLRFFRVFNSASGAAMDIFGDSMGAKQYQDQQKFATHVVITREGDVMTTPETTTAASAVAAAEGAKQAKAKKEPKEKKPKKEKEPKDPATRRGPKGTGKIAECHAYFASVKDQIAAGTLDRKAVIATLVGQGYNKGTVNIQYGKYFGVKPKATVPAAE